MHTHLKTAESRKCSILPTNLIQKYQILLLLARRDNQILVLNLSILLSKKQKKVLDGLQWLSEDILGQPMVVVQDSLRQFMVVFQERQQQLSKIVNFCANLPTFASKPSQEPGSQVRVEIWTLLDIVICHLWPCALQP